MNIKKISNCAAISFSDSKKTGWMVEEGFIYSLDGRWASLIEDHKMKHSLWVWK
jgi:hypothetical protein